MDMTTFFNMGGYALYIWGSYSLAFIILGINFIQSKKRFNKARQEIAK